MRHYLRPNHRSSTPSLIVCFDTETIPVPNERRPDLTVNRLMLGCAIRCRVELGKPTRIERTVFTSGPEFWRWFRAGLDRRKKTLLWAHNVGFDLTAAGFWTEMETGRFSAYFRRRRESKPPASPASADSGDGLLAANDPPTILDMVDGVGQRFTVLDTLNYFPVALAELGEWCGCPKLPLPGEEATQEDWISYCQADVEIVLKVVVNLLNWVRQADLGNLRYTLASQSLALFRHRGMSCQILLGHDEKLKRMERRAYYGGRVRAHYLGAVLPRDTGPLAPMYGIPENVATVQVGPVYRLDVNGAYPYVMARGNYPTAYASTIHEPSLADVESVLRTQEAVADVLVDSLVTPYPCRIDKDVRWGIGRFATTLAGPELRHALALGHVAKVFCLQLYWRGKPFKRFVEATAKLRRKYEREGNHLLARASKTLANALHGKFGQKSSQWLALSSERPPHAWGAYYRVDADTGTVETCRAIGWAGQLRQSEGETMDNFPLLAAYVSSYARLHVEQLAGVAGQGEVYYVDTDCLHVSRLGYERLEKAGWISDDQPGHLKVEHVAQVAEYRGPKHYRHDDRWTVAGVGKKARLDPRGIFHETRFHGLKSSLSGPPPEGPITQEIEYVWPAATPDGRLGEDGWLDYPNLTR